MDKMKMLDFNDSACSVSMNSVNSLANCDCECGGPDCQCDCECSE